MSEVVRYPVKYTSESPVWLKNTWSVARVKSMLKWVHFSRSRVPTAYVSPAKGRRRWRRWIMVDDLIIHDNEFTINSYHPVSEKMARMRHTVTPVAPSLSTKTVWGPLAGLLPRATWVR